ncbi:MAG: hypothetical protein RSD97_05845 [Lachnospiraceae bacterium]
MNNCFIREFPFYFNGITDEDYLYISKHISANNLDIAELIKSASLPSISERTKNDVFKALKLDTEYVFDIDTMA